MDKGDKCLNVAKKENISRKKSQSGQCPFPNRPSQTQFPSPNQMTQTWLLWPLSQVHLMPWRVRVLHELWHKRYDLFLLHVGIDQYGHHAFSVPRLFLPQKFHFINVWATLLSFLISVDNIIELATIIGYILFNAASKYINL